MLPTEGSPIPHATIFFQKPPVKFHVSEWEAHCYIPIQNNRLELIYVVDLGDFVHKLMRNCKCRKQWKAKFDQGTPAGRERSARKKASALGTRASSLGRKRGRSRPGLMEESQRPKFRPVRFGQFEIRSSPGERPALGMVCFTTKPGSPGGHFRNGIDV